MAFSGIVDVLYVIDILYYRIIIKFGELGIEMLSL